MKSMLNAVSAAAAIFMGAFALGGLAAPAMAQEVHIGVADLNLNTPQGRAQFDERVRMAAEQACPGIQELQRHSACVTAFREAADENLSDQQMSLTRQQQGETLAAGRR